MASPKGAALVACRTPGCERGVEPLPERTKCCLTCSDQPDLRGVHLAWCEVRNGTHHSQTPPTASADYGSTVVLGAAFDPRSNCYGCAHSEWLHSLAAPKGPCGCCSAEQTRRGASGPEKPECVIAGCDRTVEPGQSFYCTVHAVRYGRQGESDV